MAGILKRAAPPDGGGLKNPIFFGGLASRLSASRGAASAQGQALRAASPVLRFGLIRRAASKASGSPLPKKMGGGANAKAKAPAKGAFISRLVGRVRRV